MMKWLVLIGAALAASFAISGWSLLRLAERTDENQRALAALCAFQGDLQRRVDTSRDFLLDNPAGIPGISREDIQQSIDNQQQTIDVISPILACPA
jgi:hypothetical protein